LEKGRRLNGDKNCIYYSLAWHAFLWCIKGVLCSTWGEQNHLKVLDYCRVSTYSEKFTRQISFILILYVSCTESKTRQLLGGKLTIPAESRTHTYGIAEKILMGLQRHPTFRMRW